MKVILTRDIAKIGKKNSIIEVNNGYANNYLLKQNLAIPYNAKNAQILVQENKKNNAIQQQKIKNLEAIANQISSKPISFFHKENNGKMIGGVNSGMILKKIKSELNVSKLDNGLPKNFKTIHEFGTYTYKFNLGLNVYADIKILIKKLDN